MPLGIAPEIRISAAVAPARVHSYPSPRQAFCETDAIKYQDVMLIVMFPDESCNGAR